MTASYVEALRGVAHYLASPALWDDRAAGAALLLEAIRVEPEFAFAHFLLALHYQRQGRFELAVPHILRAFVLRAELPRQGRLGMEAIHQRYIDSDPLTAMATVEAIMADFPGLADATMPFLADAALWVGHWQGALDVSLAYLRREPVGLGAHLGYTRAATAAWALGRVALADSLHDVALRVGQAPPGPRLPATRARRLLDAWSRHPSLSWR